MSSVYKKVQKEVYRSSTIERLVLVDNALHKSLGEEDIHTLPKEARKRFQSLIENVTQLNQQETTTLQKLISEKVDRLCLRPNLNSTQDIIYRHAFHKLITRALEEHNDSTLSLKNIASLLKTNAGLIENMYIESLVSRLAHHLLGDDTIHILQLLIPYIQQTQALGNSRVICSINSCKLFPAHPVVGDFINVLLEKFFQETTYADTQPVSEDICSLLHGIIPHQQYVSKKHTRQLFSLLPNCTARDPRGNVLGEMQLYGVFHRHIPSPTYNNYQHIVSNVHIKHTYLTPNGISKAIAPSLRNIPTVQRLNVGYCIDGFMCNILLTGHNGKRYNIEVATHQQKDRSYLTPKRDAFLASKHHITVLRYSIEEGRSLDQLITKITQDLM